MEVLNRVYKETKLRYGWRKFIYDFFVYKHFVSILSRYYFGVRKIIRVFLSIGIISFLSIIRNRKNAVSNSNTYWGLTRKYFGESK